MSEEYAGPYIFGFSQRAKVIMASEGHRRLFFANPGQHPVEYTDEFSSMKQFEEFKKLAYPDMRIVGYHWEGTRTFTLPPMSVSPTP